MGRIKNSSENRRESIEADLGRLGTCLVLMDMMSERMRLLSGRGVGTGMLTPAIADAERVKALIKDTQSNITLREGTHAAH